MLECKEVMGVASLTALLLNFSTVSEGNCMMTEVHFDN